MQNIKDNNIQKAYILVCNSRDGKKFASGIKNCFIVDIPKIIKDMGYYNREIRKESEFIISTQIERKLRQGIYSNKNGNLVIINPESDIGFEENIRIFLLENTDDFLMEIINL
jgi:hypothetical protein